jgi:hypothetical protein
MLKVVLRVVISFCYAECHYAECHYAECYYGECRGALSGKQGSEGSSKSQSLNEDLQTFDYATFNVQFYSKTIFLLLVRC